MFPEDSHTEIHTHFKPEYHEAIREKQESIQFLDYFSYMDIQQPRSKINITDFWENIRNGTNDQKNFREKLLNQQKTQGTTQSWKIPPGIINSLNSRN